jgi:sarcosine oxidase subunit alpha
MTTSANWRLPAQPGEVIDRSAPLTFTWNNSQVTGYAGDTIVSALLASGERVLSRSFKYHRPRGVLSATFFDPNCMFQVGDEPNVRGAHRRVRAGDVVSSQNTWPSLRYDVKAVNQVIGRFLGPGFYYKTFIKPEVLWPTYQKVLSRFAPGGRPPALGTPHANFDKRYAHPDVLVAGGGPAGMAAAIEAAKSGAQVILVEEEYELGGHLRYGSPEDLALLTRLRAEVAALDNLEVLTDAVVSGRYDDNWVAVVQRSGVWAQERLIKARVGTLVVAAGLIERPFVFENNDLPGVMLASAALRLTGLHAVRPGSRAVVLTANANGDAAAQRLAAVGVDVVTVLDARRGETVRRAVGRSGLSSVECGDGRKISADLLVTATGWTAPTSLLNMAGDRPIWDAAAARFVPGADLPDSVMGAGGLLGDGTAEELVAHGRAVGTEAAARSMGHPAGTAPTLQPDPHPALFQGSTHGYVDFSEDVKSKDVVAAAAEGYDSAELAKRFTTAAMGPSQGKFEMVNTMAVLAEATGVDLAAVGTTVWRPPYAPISLGALAGRSYEPERRSPMQGWHESHGAVPLVAGQWIRPEQYGDPQSEARNVRTNVGIIDVTPLGKLDLRGPDVALLLDQLYVNSWGSLAVGSVRYGVMCAEDGVVMDDGVTGRLAEDHYLMTTTSSGAGSVWEWVEQWLQTVHPEWRVHVTPVTTAYASINVTGPKSRELLARLVEDIDLAPTAFPYMRVRTGTVAGVAECVVWRIGFTGELGYEVHVPASYGLHVWEALLAAGQDLGVAPFGIEAQRVLRLEKGHLIVGQDTDGLTQAYSAGLGGMVRLSKPDFAGKQELGWQEARDGNYSRLVALETVDPALVPPEASQIVVGTREIVGRVTSSRMSPTLGRSICLAQLAASLATPGATVTIVLPSGDRVEAVVREELAFVDPEGVRVRG